MNTLLNVSHSTVERKKERLMNDIKGVVADADDLLREVANSTAEEFTEARTKIEGRLEEAIARLADVRIAVTEKAKGAEEYVRENPWKTLGVGAVTGIIVAYLISRR